VRRRLFNVLAGVSLLLGLATLTVWTRSHWIGDQCDALLNGGPLPFALRIYSTRGTVEAAVEMGSPRGLSVNRFQTLHHSAPAYPLIFQSMGRTIG
jgi:hypothetical protein